MTSQSEFLTHVELPWPMSQFAYVIIAVARSAGPSIATHHRSVPLCPHMRQLQDTHHAEDAPMSP